MNIRIAITNAMQRAAICAPIAALRTTGKALSRFTPPHYSTPVNPTPSHGNNGVLHGGPRMKHRTAANTRAPRNIGVLLALLVIAFTYCWIPMASAQQGNHPTNHPAETVIIPDPNLEGNLRHPLGGWVQYITKTQMESLITADMTASRTLPLDEQITDLTGLEHATNLQSLSIGNHSVSNLSPIANLTNLTNLTLENNNISDLSPLAALTNLEELTLDENNISDLSPLANLTNLTILTLTDNRISDVTPLANLTNLTRLSVTENDVSDITPLANLTKLTNLSFNKTNVRAIPPLDGLKELTTLRGEDSQIRDISGLRGLTKLKWLFLRNNQITDPPPLGEMPNLLEINLEDNKIRDLSPLADSTSIKQVHLGGNEIRDISPIAKWMHLTPGSRLNFFQWVTDGKVRSDPQDYSRNPLSYPSIYTHSVTLINENSGLWHEFYRGGRFFRNIFLYAPRERLRAPTTLEIVSEAEQTVRSGESVEPLVVRVLTQDDEPFAGVPVVFAVTAGEGTVETAETATHDPTHDFRDEIEGQAMTTFTVGTALGQRTVVATVTHKATDETRALAFNVETTFNEATGRLFKLNEGPVFLEDTTLEATFTINVLPGALDAPTVVAPADPTALQVSWAAPVYAIANYEVRYRVDGSDAWTVAAYKGTEPSTTLTDLIPGTTYEWQVRAQTSVGPSPWSPSQRGTTGHVLLQTRELSPSPVASDRLVFNELRNADDDTHDWLELKNISDADIALADWEVSIVSPPGGGTPEDRDIVDFPDYTLPAGEVLLIVNTDPRQTDLAGGVDIKTGEGKRGARHRYFVSAALKLPSSPYLLLLRSVADKNGTPDAVEDIAGNYFRESGDFAFGEGTQVWPLQDTARPLSADAALLTAGEAWARVSTETRGYLAAAWGKSGHQAGLGYQQNVAAAEMSLGTPGYANAAIVAEAPSGRVSISELMFATKAGRRTVPQWIELYNNSTTEAVKLAGWRLEIEYLNGENARRHRFDAVTLTPLTVLPNQTVLLATWRAETSGHFPEGKVYNLYFEHPNAFNQRERRNDVLNAAGFSVRLLDASGTLVDSVGNLDGVARTKDVPVWEVPSGTTAEGARVSLIRKYEDSAPLPGTDADSWKSAANVKLAVSTYYGWETDIGTPGYREGGPLPVVLSHFQSVRTAAGVVIRWTTESSVDNAGFNLLRSESRSGPFTKINPALIAGSGTTGESSAYVFTDGAAKPGVVYYYRLEEVSFGGVVQPLVTMRVRGQVSASGKRVTRWSELKF